MSCVSLCVGACIAFPLDILWGKWGAGARWQVLASQRSRYLFLIDKKKKKKVGKEKKREKNLEGKKRSFI